MGKILWDFGDVCLNAPLVVPDAPGASNSEPGTGTVVKTAKDGAEDWSGSD